MKNYICIASSLLLLGAVALPADAQVATSSTNKKSAEPSSIKTIDLSGPAWIHTPKSPWYNLPPYAKLPFIDTYSSESLKGHENLKETKLEAFAWLHINLLVKLDGAYSHLYNEKIALEKKIAESKSDTTESKKLLAIADQKMDAAKSAIQAVRAYTPHLVQGQGNVSFVKPASIVPLKAPRNLGAEAIKSLNEAKSALLDVVTSLKPAANRDSKVNL